MKLEEDVLSYVRLKLGASTAEDIESDIKPVVYCGVNGVIFVADLLRSAFLCKGSCL